MKPNGPESRDPLEARNRMVKLAFGLGALGCLLTGLAVYLFAPALGIGDDAARVVAIAFLAAGAADYLLLHFWDRIAGDGRR